MLHEQTAKAIIDKTITVKAKDEKQAVQKLNKALKKQVGYGFKIYQHKGYYGKYVLSKTFNNRYDGTDYLEFNIAEIEEGLYGIGKPNGGFNQID